MSYVAAAIAGSAVVGAGASIFGGYEQSKAIKAGENQISANQNQSLQALMQMFQTGKSELQPFQSAGAAALPTLQSLLTPGPGQTQALSQLPGFQFAQDWGQKGVTAQATTRGLGGNALRAGAQFATGTAQQGFSGLVGLLQNFANMGQSAGANIMSGANQVGGNVANVNMQSGGNLASLMVGGGNALAGAGAGVANSAGNLANLAILKQLIPGLGGSTGGMYGGKTGIPGDIAGQVAA